MGLGLKFRRRKAFVTTETELKAIAHCSPYTTPDDRLKILNGGQFYFLRLGILPDRCCQRMLRMMLNRGIKMQ